MRKVMVASVSHELKTPLNGLMILLNCAETIVSEKVRTEMIEPAITCADFLQDFINNIIDYTKMSSTKLDLTYQPVDIR